ncbi:MAG: hypothetical protein SWC40_07520, partial [Thermodesulfobacteriota bacterium]|nr:hypothetical protein [Thermodesulfobacteriota bacterium]
APFPLVPKLQLGNGLTEAGASAQLCSQAGAWEQEAKDLHPVLSVLSRCLGRQGKSHDFHGRLTNRAFKGGLGSWHTGLDHHAQNQLNQ